MNRLRILVALGLVGVGMLLAAGHASAQAAHYWYDGNERRPLFLDSQRVVEFRASRGSKAAVVKSTAVAITKDAGTSTSPMFKDGPQSNAAVRALPGGVLVTLRAGTPKESARAALVGMGLVPVRSIGDDGHVWLVFAQPGMESLTLANQLHEGGKVESATPNWWQPRALK